jgi:hypothetical protein
VHRVVVAERRVDRIAGFVLGLAAVALGLSLGACTTSRQIVLPSGQQGFTVDCSGTNLSWSHCYRKASRVCGQGYVISHRISGRGNHPVVGDLFGLMGGSVSDRSLLIQCRTAALGDGSAAPRVPSASSSAPADSGVETFPDADDDD